MNITNVSAQLECDLQDAYSLVANGQLDKAEAICTELIKQHPDESSILNMLGTIASLKGEQATARRLLEASLRIIPDQADIHLRLSTILFNLGDFGSALDAIDRALALDNSSPEAWNNRGIVLSALGRTDDALHDLDKSIELRPDYVEALHNRGRILQGMGHLASAAENYRKVVDLQPSHAIARYDLAIIQVNQGDHAAALANLTQVLAAHPEFVDALVLRGRILFERGQLDDALVDTEKALGIFPEHAGALFQKGYIQLQRGDVPDALACFTRATSLAPNDVNVLLALGVTRYNLKDYPGAIEAFDAVIVLDRNMSQAYNNKGLVLQELKRYDEAVSHYRQALALRPDDPDPLYNLANANRELGFLVEALAQYDLVLEIMPGHYNALINKAATLDKLNRPNDALGVYKLLIEKYPADAEAYVDAGRGFAKLNKPELAIGYANKALKLDSRNVNALYIRAQALLKLGLIAYAMMDAETALRLDPHHPLSNFMMGSLYEEQKRPADAVPYLENAARGDDSIDFLLGKLAHQRMHMSNWKDFHPTAELILNRLDAGKPACQPFDLQSLVDAPDYHKRCAELYFDHLYRVGNSEPFSERYEKDRLHIAYFSSDIGSHPVSYLMAGVFEAHDRKRFEVTLFLLNNHSDGARDRICNACEHVVNVEFMTDDEIARLSRTLKVDIAIDLNGYTSKNRTGIFARRAAPIQVSYIGFLGTMGSDCYDYIIGDPVIAPLEHERHFSEKIIQLPCYQANDDKLSLPETRYVREDFGLPANAFVFCSFNANYKITPDVFAVWMSILEQVPQSVLWLFCKSDEALANLRSAASAHGVSSDRLIPASRVPYLDHLARHRLADLFLDTHPYNGGATASNALYAGLPMVTYAGKSFCSRYGASLLTALDLPELITDSLDGYTALSVRLACDRAYYDQVRSKLAANIKTSPLFDTRLFTRHLEQAYLTIGRRHAEGRTPAHLPVNDVIAAAY